MTKISARWTSIGRCRTEAQSARNRPMSSVQTTWILCTEELLNENCTTQFLCQENPWPLPDEWKIDNLPTRLSTRRALRNRIFRRIHSERGHSAWRRKMVGILFSHYNICSSCSAQESRDHRVSTGEIGQNTGVRHAQIFHSHDAK